MPLSTSNTYITPQNTSTIGGARPDINGSIRAVMQNFYSPAAPTSANISDDGALTDPYPGTLFFSSSSLALYYKSATTVTGGQYSGQGFTRRGISYRVEQDATSASANIAGSYEVGEMYYRLDNNKYYFKDSGGSAVEVASGTITVADGSVTPAKLAAGSLIQFNTGGNFTIGDTSVRTEGNVVIKPTNDQFPPPSLELLPSGHASSRHVRFDIDNWRFQQDTAGNGTKNLVLTDQAAAANRIHITTGGLIGIGTGATTPLATLHVGAGADSPTVSTGTALYVTNAGVTNLAVRDSTNDVEITANASSTGGAVGTATNHTLFLRTNNQDKVLVDINGNVGINVTSARARFDIRGASVSGITALTDGATITPDFSSNNYFSVTLAGNRTLANPTNLATGQSGIIFVTQDGTGNRTLSFGTNYKFPGGVAPTLTSTANANDAIVYTVRTSTAISCQVVLDIR